MRIKQGTMTVLAPIRTDGDHEKELEKLFRPISDDIYSRLGCGSEVPLRKVTSLHYARFVILRDHHMRRSGDPPFSPCLLLSTQFDGPLDDHLRELIKIGTTQKGGGLESIYDHCVGFDAAAGPIDRRLFHYLKDRIVRANAFYVGARGRSVGRIFWELEVAKWIRSFAGDLPRDVDPAEAWRRIGAHVREKLKETRPPAEKMYGPASAEAANWTRFSRRSRRLWGLIWGSIGLIPLLFLVFLPWPTFAVVLIAVVLGLWLRISEERDEDDLESDETVVSNVARSALRRAHEERLRAHEDVWPQNQLSVVSTVKPTLLRLRLLRVVLRFIQFRARFKFTRGLLAGVPTIHSAHWTLFDGGRRLIFVSNYDGSWSGYLDEFVEHAPSPLTAIWSNVRGFPKTRFLLWDGARDGRRFKEWARADLVPPEVFYSAYPHLSVENVNLNTELIEGLEDKRLGRPKYRNETLEWLSKV